MINHQAPPLHPTPKHIAFYITFLNQKFKAPTSVYNHLSGAKTTLRDLGLNVEAFKHPLVALAKKGVARSSSHVPQQAPPFTPQLLATCVSRFKDGGHMALVLTASLLVSYFSMLRQSNIFFTSSRSPHQLAFTDVQIKNEILYLTIRSTKTRHSLAQQFIMKLPSIKNTHYCPVKAWRAYTRVFKPPHQGPAFITPQGLPLPASTLLKAIRQALRDSNVPDASSITLHSLRRGAAQASALAGASIEQVMQAGTWASQSVHTYVPKSYFQPPSALSNLFGGGQNGGS